MRISSRVACSSGWRSRARSRSSRAFSCSTSRSPRSTPRCGYSSGRRSGVSSSSSGITTLYVTHDQEEALSISDRVAVLHDGRIDQVGTPPEMYGNPATPFVAEFIGTMNRLVSKVAGDGLVEHAGRVLHVDAARGLPPGERVLLLVRPETVAIEAVGDDGGAGGGAGRRGRLAHLPRLGHPGSDRRCDRRGGHHGRRSSVTRCGASHRNTRRGPLPARESAPAQPGGAARTRRSRSGRSVKIPSTPSAASSRIRSGSFTV